MSGRHSGRHGEKADTCGNAGMLDSIGENRCFIGEKGIGRETLRATLGRYCGTLALLMFYALCGFGAALVPDLRRLSDFSKIIAERFDTLKPGVQSRFPLTCSMLSKIIVAR